jgi:hypothetical protein
MKTSFASTLLLALMSVITSPCALSGSTLRCEHDLISLDDTTGEVQDKCGAPADRSMLGFKEKVDEYGFRNEVQVEEWIYGPRNGMYHYLRFEGNRLVRIDSKRG